MASTNDGSNPHKGTAETPTTESGNGKLVKQPPAPPQLQEPSHQAAPVPDDSQRKVSPPSKRDLTSWWKQFKKNTKKEEDKKIVPPGIFGVPLGVSIKYANVAISLLNEQGESFIYGYVPIVVAKCGVYLKENATEVEGIFRLSGSAKRIRDLQTIFDSPDRYGKGLDWSGYTVHDGANILRRYLNQLPEPIVPLDFYERFRDPLRSVQLQAAETNELQTLDAKGFDHDAAVVAYQKLITELPPLNRQLLLYILDLLAVFASKSELNKMTSANLSAIFQPGLLSHPTHDMAPAEYKLSQYVLIFLIENQDNFLIGMSGTAADEKTVKEVQSGAIPTFPAAKAATGIGRSASNASAGADSLRKYGGVRRNVSTSSRTSRASANNGPSTPKSGTGFAGSASSGLHRSNTVPSKKSPGLPSARFNKPSEPSTPTSGASLTPQAAYSRSNTGPSSPLATSSNELTPQASSSTPLIAAPEASDSSTPVAKVTPERADRFSPHPSPSMGPVATPIRERKISGLFGKSPASDSEKKELRPPNKLKKKRIPSSAISSAQSSAASLALGDLPPPSPGIGTPLASPDPGRSNPMESFPVAVNAANPEFTQTNPSTPAIHESAIEAQYPSGTSTLRPRPKSPAPSNHSRSSITDHSDFDVGDPSARHSEKHQRRRWRFSSAGKDNQNELGTHPMAQYSTSSIGSGSRPRKSFTNDSQNIGTDMSASSAGFVNIPNTGSDLKEASPTEPERKGIFGKLKAKMAQSRERAKSPPRSDHEADKSKQSLNAIVAEGVPAAAEKPVAAAPAPTATATPAATTATAETPVTEAKAESSTAA